MVRVSKHIVASGVVAATCVVASGAAIAGGFAIREQSAVGQGMSFAGSAAYTSISAMFWNSAAAANQNGLNAESGAALILPQAELTATTGTTLTRIDDQVEIGVNAIVPSTYLTYQFKNFDPNLFIGLGINSGFGLKTEPDNRWTGSQVAGATSLFTTNINPMLAYRLSEQLSIGVGAQIQYAKGILKFATGTPTGPNSYFEGDDLAVGGTAGIMFTPNPGTRIGLGYRSQITHKLEGTQGTTGAPTGSPALNAGVNAGIGAEVEIKLPDIVTLSFSQALSPNARVMGTVEWSNWSRLESLPLVTTSTGFTLLNNPGGTTGPGVALGSISTKWDDGWFFALGMEYDVSPLLTLRAGGAYEISPVTKATERSPGIPDADRIWASVGLSYAFSKTTTIDFGYTHLFVEDAHLDRDTISTPTRKLVADLDASLDIVSLGVRMKLDHDSAPLK